MTTNFYVGLLLLTALVVLALMFIAIKPDEDKGSGTLVAVFIVGTALTYVWALGVSFAIRLMLR